MKYVVVVLVILLAVMIALFAGDWTWSKVKSEYYEGANRAGATQRVKLPKPTAVTPTRKANDLLDYVVMTGDIFDSYPDELTRKQEAQVYREIVNATASTGTPTCMWWSSE
jgi:hypothetical protein